MKDTAPLVFGFVMLFGFVILLAAFRSIVIALKAIVLNLLSVAAAYGILVAVFQWGWGENLLDFKEMGIGLAAAILIDATIVRAVLLPASMSLLGDRNWYLPKWLSWLPRLDHEREQPADIGPLPQSA